jgi:hypothetical protein
MIRIVGGFLIVIGSAGGMEMTSLSPMGALIFGSIGFGIFLWGVADGTVKRLEKQAIEEMVDDKRSNKWLYR